MVKCLEMTKELIKSQKVIIAALIIIIYVLLIKLFTDIKWLKTFIKSSLVTW